MTSNFDWSRFAVRINIDAPVSMLYKAWTTRSGIEEWFLRMGEYKKPDGTLRDDDETVEKGDTYRWRWYGYPDSVTEEGTVLEMNGKDFFKFSFGKGGDCSVSIRQEQGENIVELLQEKIPTDEKGKQDYHVGCKTGWTFYLANLKAIFEGGTDLRNKKEELQEMLNA